MQGIDWTEAQMETWISSIQDAPVLVDYRMTPLSPFIRDTHVKAQAASPSRRRVHAVARTLPRRMPPAQEVYEAAVDGYVKYQAGENNHAICPHTCNGAGQCEDGSGAVKCTCDVGKAAGLPAGCYSGDQCSVYEYYPLWPAPLVHAPPGPSAVLPCAAPPREPASACAAGMAARTRRRVRAPTRAASHPCRPKKEKIVRCNGEDIWTLSCDQCTGLTQRVLSRPCVKTAEAHAPAWRLQRLCACLSHAARFVCRTLSADCIRSRLHCLQHGPLPSRQAGVCTHSDGSPITAPYESHTTNNCHHTDSGVYVNPKGEVRAPPPPAA